MKLERISDNQIRCTLNKNDLISRELKISELAYGSEKAKELFRDMMAQASDELGFEAEDIPLMIEAIPISGDCIILIITKVEDPEELDTRFSRFTSSVPEDDEDALSAVDDEGNDHTEYTGADEILDLFKQLQQNIAKGLKAHAAAREAIPEDADESHSDENIEIIRIFTFKCLNDVSLLAEVLKNTDGGMNTLYKNEQTGLYYLVLSKGTLSPELFNKICNIATEYGQRESFTYATTAYYDEHYTKIIQGKALQVLASL